MSSAGIEDRPQFAVISRETGTPFINIYSRHATLSAAESLDGHHKGAT